MIKEMLNYMENDGTIPKREIVTPSDSDDDDVTEVHCTGWKFAEHNVEITEFFCHSDFM